MALEAAGLEADESLLNGESEPVAKQPGDTLLSGSSVIAEQVRADAADTLRYFMEQGIALRVISGGHPQTVAAIARQVGVPGADEPVDAHHSAWKDRLAPLVKDRSAFGRVSPCDKQQMAAALQAKGRVVAMVGGGVLLGVGAAMVYPALLAAIGDAVHPGGRASTTGVHRLWRDPVYAIGALLSGIVADLFGISAAMWLVAALTFVSGLAAAIRLRETRHSMAA